MTNFILVRQHPDTDEGPGAVTAHDVAFGDVHRASKVAGQFLFNILEQRGASAQRKASKLAKLPVGTIWTHEDSGYRFRILTAHYTEDNPRTGVPIIPGLRVRTNDNWWGTVYPDQFMVDGVLQPGGLYFDGWYHVHRENSTSGARYNGERLSVRGMS